MLPQRKEEQFRGILTKWRADLEKELIGSNDQASPNEEEVYADWTDVATVETDKAMQLKIRDRERTLMAEIQEALKRLDDHTFGECERCGEQISESRLKASPVTTLCIDCKTELEGTAHRYR